MARLEADGMVPTAEELARFHSPVGLDIGAETPEEIALAIIAEIQGALQGRAGGALRLRAGPIHR
jgi:xanthine/CO dehydrogenase XdhC/CoxF family maturation factor